MQGMFLKQYLTRNISGKDTFFYFKKAQICSTKSILILKLKCEISKKFATCYQPHEA